MYFLENKRKVIEDYLRGKIKFDIDCHWVEGFRGEQIIEISIEPRIMIIKVTLDIRQIIGDPPERIGDLILFYIKREILNYFLF